MLIAKKTDVQKKKSLRLEVVGCCGTETATRKGQEFWKQLDSD